MLAEQMQLIFDVFPQLLERYIELRADDWTPDGVAWSYQTRTGLEEVSLTVRKDTRGAYLMQSRQHAVTEDGSPVGEAVYSPIKFRAASPDTDSTSAEGDTEG